MIAGDEEQAMAEAASADRVQRKIRKFSRYSGKIRWMRLTKYMNLKTKRQVLGRLQANLRNLRMLCGLIINRWKER